MDKGNMANKFLSVAAYSFLFVKVSYLAYTVFQNYRSKRSVNVKSSKPNELWNTAIFFPDEVNSTASRDQLIWYLQQAEKSLKICMHLVNSPLILKIISKQLAAGIEVQIITMGRSLPSLLPKGYDVKVNPLNNRHYLMHHKFVIVDDEALLTGSLNWTPEGLNRYNENVLITTNPRAVKQYLEEFEMLWNISQSPSVRHEF